MQKDKPDHVQPADVMNVLEVIFKNLLKRRVMVESDAKSLKIRELYDETWLLLMENLLAESAVCLKVCFQLIKVEAKNPIPPRKGWPAHRIREILETLVGAEEETPTVALTNYGKYCKNLDVLDITIMYLVDLVPQEDFKDAPTKAMNFLSLVNLLDLGKSVLSAAEYHVETAKARTFSLEKCSKRLNEMWTGVMAKSSGVDEKLHRQILVVLLERIINRLEDPIQLTDFLMDSLHQFGLYFIPEWL